VHPLSKRVVLGWIASDLIWASLFVYVEKRNKR
jgi:hypothetical protein